MTDVEKSAVKSFQEFHSFIQKKNNKKQLQTVSFFSKIPTLLLSILPSSHSLFLHCFSDFHLILSYPPPLFTRNHLSKSCPKKPGLISKTKGTLGSVSRSYSFTYGVQVFLPSNEENYLQNQISKGRIW